MICLSMGFCWDCCCGWPDEDVWDAGWSDVDKIELVSYPLESLWELWIKSCDGDSLPVLLFGEPELKLGLFFAGLTADGTPAKKKVFSKIWNYKSSHNNVIWEIYFEKEESKPTKIGLFGNFRYVINITFSNSIDIYF